MALFSSGLFLQKVKTLLEGPQGQKGKKNFLRIAAMFALLLATRLEVKEENVVGEAAEII